MLENSKPNDPIPTTFLGPNAPRAREDARAMTRQTSLGADDIVRLLGLAPHPEGGFFRETFRGDELPFPLPDRGPRSTSTAIYFLLRRSDFSAFHRVRSDEGWHHYLGAPLELHLIDREGHQTVLLGCDFERGARPQAVVRTGVLQAARLAPFGRDGAPPAPDNFALLGCTVAPGFDFADFEMPPRSALMGEHPNEADIIRELTRA
jgi:predicted cupin superfamily sugar epimerase